MLNVWGFMILVLYGVAGLVCGHHGMKETVGAEMFHQLFHEV